MTNAHTNDRLQKLLAQVGLGSRREIEGWITEGRVRLNGRLAVLGDRAGLSDRIQVDGRVVRLVHKPGLTRRRVYMYHKPSGEVCSRKDEEGRMTIFERLPRLRGERWISVGRLDLNTCGLLLLTTDGDLANQLMHPSNQIEREYAVRVLGEVSSESLHRLTTGIRLEDGIASFATLKEAGGEGANHWYHVTVKEGRNRLVRRLWEAEGVTVSRLMRVRFGPLTLPPYLKVGQGRELEDREVDMLFRALDTKA